MSNLVTSAELARASSALQLFEDADPYWDTILQVQPVDAELREAVDAFRGLYSLADSETRVKWITEQLQRWCIPWDSRSDNQHMNAKRIRAWLGPLTDEPLLSALCRKQREAAGRLWNYTGD